jgi:hypothetical protein
MAWNGYFAFGGSEIINTQRTETYLADASQSWWTPVYNSTSVSEIEDEEYLSAWLDPAPWGDPDNPDTYRFYGAYPLNINDGGWISAVRKATRNVVFELLLTGEDECAVEAGFRWLKSALSPAPCNDFGCNGTELCFYDCEPCVGDSCSAADVQACAKGHIRTLRNVKVVSGPTITARRTTSDGAAIWVVSFTLVAGVPFQFGDETPLVEGFMVAADPWVPDIVPADWDYSVGASTKEDAVCAVPAYTPIIDPLCPAVLVPPGPPSVQIGCFTAPDEWTRRWFTIPRKYIPYWGDAVPVIRIQAMTDDIRGLRLRFYSDLDADASVKDDPCSYCGDILFSYIPADHTLVFDGMTQTVSAEGPGGTLHRADSLVFKTDGTPFEWPVLSCGFGYVVTVDLPPDFDGVLPAVDLSIVGRAS